MSRVVVITGLPRSGTTLVGYCVGGHPDAWNHDESWLVRSLCMHQAQWRKHGILDERLSNEATARAATAFYSHVLAAKGKKVSVEKCPPLSCIYDKVCPILDKMDVLFVWCYRDPHDTYQSWVRTFRQNVMGVIGPMEIAKEGEVMLVDLFAEAYDLSEKNMAWATLSNRCVGVKYEDFVSSESYRRRKLSDICEASGLSKDIDKMFDSAMGSTGSVHSDVRFARSRRIYETSVGVCERNNPEIYDLVERALNERGRGVLK